MTRIEDIVGTDVLRKDTGNSDQSLKNEVEILDDYISLTRTNGWKRLEREIQDRTNSLSRRLLTVDGERDLYRVQGELLGIQSILNLVDVAIENGRQAREILERNTEGENDGKEA